MEIETYISSMDSIDTLRSLVNPSMVLFFWILFAHLYRRFTLQASTLEPMEVSGEKKVADTIQVETALPQVLPQAPQVLPQAPQAPQAPQNTRVEITAAQISDFDVTLIDALFTLKRASARDIRKSLTQAIPDLTLSQVNSTLYTLLKRGVVTMTKDGIVPLWSVSS